MRQGGLSRRAMALVEVACVAMLALAALGRFGLAQAPATLSGQSQEDADRKSAGCTSCHTQTDQRTMHRSSSVRLGCTDCHGGNATVKADGPAGSPAYERARRQAHVAPRHPEAWKTAANPERSYPALLDESLDFVRFLNPGDLRAAPVACGACHAEEVRVVSKSLMTHGAFLYEAATYNNGVLPGKD